ncbi:GNAT family N-acetyltransferase [Kitasatospora azatica]|uniref:GNAT family N-acetyltransferase n=1 Tax=Kitasatospora azatica TaxID=58347 RepID=UPI000561CB8A|nr:GNAT family N-acetyltransferase [Kitasatospora azatica]
MTWTLTDSLDEFRAHAGDYLAAHPAENTVLLTIVSNLAGGGTAGGDPSRRPRFGWWRASEDAPVAGAWAQTPPFPLRLGRMPVEAARELLDALTEHRELAGVSGGVVEARAFAEAWAERTGGTVEIHEEQRLYRLGELTPPATAGRLRPARPADRELLIDWFGDFFAVVGVQPHDVESIVAHRAARGDLHIWEDEAGRAVSFAGLSQVTAGMTRIGPVYTPPELRGNGYASAVTAAISAVGCERGASEVLLFTDLANPTSNSIYQKIGFRPLGDSVILNFTADPARTATPTVSPALSPSPS